MRIPPLKMKILLESNLRAGVAARRMPHAATPNLPAKVLPAEIR